MVCVCGVHVALRSAPGRRASSRIYTALTCVLAWVCGCCLGGKSRGEPPRSQIVRFSFSFSPWLVNSVAGGVHGGLG